MNQQTIEPEFVPLPHKELVSHINSGLITSRVLKTLEFNYQMLLAKEVYTHAANNALMVLAKKVYESEKGESLVKENGEVQSVDMQVSATEIVELQQKLDRAKCDFIIDPNTLPNSLSFGFFKVK